jgi:hypothetical protein
MSDEPRSPFITRAELYPILGSVYLLIALALLGLVRQSGESVLLLIGHYLLFGVALGMSITFNVLAIRERRRGTRSAAGEPPRDRPPGSW